MAKVKDYSDDPGKKIRSRRLRTLRVVLLRTLIFILTLVVVLVGILYSALRVLFFGPSKTARDIFVVSTKETSALKSLPLLFLNQEEVDAIIEGNIVKETDEITDPGLVVIVPKDDDDTSGGGGDEDPTPPIEIEDVTGSSYKGKMMIVHDPSRVFVGTCKVFGESIRGRKVIDMVADYNAIAGVNGGGFVDTGGVGKGGMPTGIVITQGELVFGSLNRTYEVIGFDSDHKLVVGKMTGQKALDMGIRDAVSFGPILIVNSKPSEVSGTGGGFNPRTAIGQRADGAVLILVIDGRQPNSLGATHKDLIDIMLRYGAVNAANLDGGTSTNMVYEGEIISMASSLYGTRTIPTSILVSRED